MSEKASANWEEIDRLFNDAADLSPKERELFLSKNCSSNEIRAGVEKLLAAEDAAAGFLDRPVFEPASLRPPSRIGDWRIFDELGKGGMGTVYLAENKSLGLRAALKVIRQGFDSDAILRRFDAERKILATLQHPNIARLIDGGTTDDGRPFYVMEYADGVTIDDYCRDLSVKEKLRVFQQVCRAVEFAHARLIVHRDIKPSNIIVDSDGTAKLLDFGIAKLISTEGDATSGTATLLGMMTPSYASPEQIRGEQVTTATDVYSLGVVLYELLTGRLPRDFRGLSLERVLAALNAGEATRPSAATSTRSGNSKLDVDIDNIVLKSLKMEPERRYQSVKEFSADIDRFLNGLPVSARPDSFRYRATKFIRRNSIAVGATVLVFLSLLGGIGVATWQAVVAREQKALAEKRFADVRELANKVVFTYDERIARMPGSTAIREELVGDALHYLDSLNSTDLNDPELNLELARAYERIGDVQGRPYAANLGKSEDAMRSYEKALEILRDALSKSPEPVAVKRQLLQTLLRYIPIKARLNKVPRDEIVEAASVQAAISDSTPGEKDANSFDRASVLIARADHGDIPTRERIEIYLAARDDLLSIEERTIDVQHSLSRAYQRLGTNWGWLGDELSKKGDRDGAFAAYKNAVPFNEEMFISVRKEIEIGGLTQNLRRIEAGVYQNLGESLFKIDKRAEGYEMLKKNLAISEELLRGDERNTEGRVDVANALFSLADAYAIDRRFADSIASSKRGLAILARVTELDPGNFEVRLATLARHRSLIKVLELAEKNREAELFRAAVARLCSGLSEASCTADERR